MQTKAMTTDPGICGLLRCPVCGAGLAAEGTALLCINPECGARYPVVDGIPILIDEKRSVFSFSDFEERRTTFFQRESALKRLARRWLPSISWNPGARRRYKQFIDELRHLVSRPRILIVGGSAPGMGIDDLLAADQFELVETDVSFGPRTAVVCDGHALPFDPCIFDGVVIQAVLEHVVDPARCVEEIRRVLRPEGVVYAETAFMQQVHGGAYDFSRVTPIGHRRLFHGFAEISSGACCGPGMALGWSVQFFLLSTSRNESIRSAIKVACALTLFWLKYLDLFLKGPAAMDAASGLFFMGKKSPSLLSDKELIKLYMRPTEGVSA
jgi:SAM-dependent methyltransferase